MIEDIEIILESSIRLGHIFLFAALGEYVAERAGTINISLEGMLLAGAFGGALGASETGSPVLGIFAGIAAGFIISYLQANLSHRLNIDQFVVGIALTVLSIGLTTFLFLEIKIYSGRIHEFAIPVLSEIPIIGTALFAQRWLGYVAFVLPFFIWAIVHRTRWGLEVRSVGEDPSAANVSGIPVLKRRRQSIYIAGMCAGLSGAYLSLAVTGAFSQNMSAGKGVVAIAAVLFGGWTLFGTICGSLLFGFADALGLSLQIIGFNVIPGPVLDSMPYLLALIGLLTIANMAKKPAALAENFDPSD
ncbi:MAG: ABC transporter permease [Flammeovirgaceae bacterium]|nr:ABC transporter permease [Flammeovirgaceae bacterium]|tara:strand:- start:1620 stop:2528 length:909 start_codon:yes stop_codon:yes gene_type:complete